MFINNYWTVVIIRESGLLLSNIRSVWRYSFLTLQILKVSTSVQHRLDGLMCFSRQLRAWLRNHYATLTPNTPRRERPRKQYTDNIKQWTQLTTSQCVRAAEDRSRWKQLVSQAMVANDHT